MDLSKELRMCIYEQIVGPYTWPHTTLKDIGSRYRRVTRQDLELSKIEHGAVDNRQCFGDSRMQNFGLDPEHKLPPLQRQLPLVSRTVASEFWALSMHHTNKHITCPDLIPCLVHRARPEHLRRVSPGFFNASYFDLLGFGAHPRDGNALTGNNAIVSVYGRTGAKPLSRPYTLTCVTWSILPCCLSGHSARGRTSI
jgi:hypothetical protein